MKKQTTLAMVVIGILCLALVISSITMVTYNVLGGNITNDTLLAKVYVWNTEPNISRVVISPTTIDLEPGNTTLVSCTGYVFDWNGWQDIKFINATFYHSSVSSIYSDDYNNHYTNSTGSCIQDGSSRTNATCTASFNVWYFADNGTWTCNMTITDLGMNISDSSRNITFNRSDDASVTVTKLLALVVPDELDYGNLSVTELSENKSLNITNWGNVPINISVYGYAGTNESAPQAVNYSMFCQYGNISAGYQRYTSDVSSAYADMTNLSNTSTLIPDWELPVRTNDSTYGPDSNETYWRIQIPYSVGGYCNGTIVFSAAET